MCNEIWKINADFSHVIDLANLRCVCKRLREIDSLNENIRSYLVFSKKVFNLDFNHNVTLFFESIFDGLGFCFNLPDMLHFRYQVFSLFKYFQCDQFFAHFFYCSRSEVSFSSCEIDNQIAQLIIEKCYDVSFVEYNELPDRICSIESFGSSLGSLGKNVFT